MTGAIGQVSSGVQEPPAPYSIGGFVYKEVDGVRVVGCGVDTLYHNFGMLADVLAARQPEFEGWKLEAQASKEGRRRVAVGGEDLFLSAKGRGHYAYVFLAPGLGEVMISYNPLFKGHPVRVKLYSDFLAGCSSSGEQDAGALRLVELVFGPGCIIGTQVSEYHLAVDFVGWVPSVPDFQQRRFVCPAGPTLENVDFADGVGLVNSVRWSKHGAPLSAVLYNKSKEVREQSEHKQYLFDKWRLAGWNESLGDVYRLEFRFTREWLRERDIDAPSDVDQAALLASGMDWLELRDRDGLDSNSARWPVSSVWLRIEAQASEILQGLWVPYVRAYVPNVTPDQLVAQVGGCVACLGALVGHDDLGDLFTVARAMYEQKLQRQKLNFASMVGDRRDRYMLPVGGLA